MFVRKILIIQNTIRGVGAVALLHRYNCGKYRQGWKCFKPEANFRPMKMLILWDCNLNLAVSPWTPDNLAIENLYRMFSQDGTPKANFLTSCPQRRFVIELVGWSGLISVADRVVSCSDLLSTVTRGFLLVSSQISNLSIVPIMRNIGFTCSEGTRNTTDKDKNKKIDFFMIENVF